MNDNNTLFMDYVRANDLDAVSELLKSKIVTWSDVDDALTLSVKNMQIDMILKILSNFGNFSVNNTAIDYALRWSAKLGHLDIVIKLLEMGANVNINNCSYYYSTLELAVDYNHLDIVIKLLEFGADVHHCDDLALQWSAQRKRFNIMAKLLENGANIGCKNKYILKGLQKNFDERMADIILPYCCFDDYEYFPTDYIRRRIVSTKGANTANA